MTPGPKQYQKYKQTNVMTASRGQILIMLYEAVIRNIKKAMDAIDKNDLVAKGEAIVKAHEILNELANTLDFEVGGEISRNLERLYNFQIEQLVKANIENSKVPLEAAKKTLETLLSGWREAVKNFEKTGGPKP